MRNLARAAVLALLLTSLLAGSPASVAPPETTAPAAPIRGFAGAPEGGFRQSWHTHRGFVPIFGIRQNPPDLRIRWRTEPVPPGSRGVLSWTGAMGSGASRGGNFTLSINGRRAAEFDVAVEPTRFPGLADGCELLYDVVWVYENGLDSSGRFYLTVPPDWVKAGEAATIEVEGKDIGSHRWFGLLGSDEPPARSPRSRPHRVRRRATNGTAISTTIRGS